MAIEFKDIYGNRVGYVSENDIKDIYGNKVGYFSGTDIKDTYGNKVGYFSGTDIKDTYGNRVGFTGTDIKDTYGNRLGYAVGSASDLEMAAAALLLFKNKINNNKKEEIEESSLNTNTDENYFENKSSYNSSNIQNVFNNDESTHNFFESVRNSQIEAKLQRKYRYEEEQRKKKEALYLNAKNKLKIHDKDGAIMSLSIYINTDYDCKRVSGDNDFDSIREDCNRLILKYEEKMAQSKSWKEAGLCSYCGGKIKIFFEGGISGSESWVDRLCSRECKNCYNMISYKPTDPKIKKLRTSWKIISLCCALFGSLLIGNIFLLIPFLIIFLLPWDYWGSEFIKFLRISSILVQVVISIIMIVSIKNLFVIPIIIGSIILNLSCIMAYKESIKNVSY